MAKEWANVRMTVHTKASLEKFRRKLEQQWIEGRVLHWSPHERFGVSLDLAIRELLIRDAAHGLRARKARKKTYSSGEDAPSGSDGQEPASEDAQ